MKRILVTYYSLTGNTAKVAVDLATRLGADVLPLHERAPRRGFFGYLRAAIDSLRERPSALEPPGKFAGDYDLVIVGTPIWVGRITPAARAYLHTIRGGVTRVAFFITSGATDISSVQPTLEKLAGAPALAATGFAEPELRDSLRYEQKLKEFVATLRGAAKVSAPGATLSLTEEHV